MKVSEQVAQHVDRLGLHLNSNYQLFDVKLAIKRLFSEQKLKIQKTDSCPTTIPFFWYRGKLEISNKVIKSSGEGFQKNKAQIRCVGELLERIPIHIENVPCRAFQKGKMVPLDGYKLTASNGLSFALNLKEGVFNSYRELVERQVVLDYWLKKKPCLEIKGLNKWNFLNWSSAFKNGLKSRFYYLPNPYGLFVVCCHISCDKKIPHNIFGYGSHEEIEKAMEKAFLEVWRFYWEYQKLDKSVAMEKNNEVKRFIDHFKFYSSNKDTPPAYFPKKKISFRKLKRKLQVDENFKYDELYIFELKKYNLPGYCIKITRNDFWDFKPGALEEDLEERKRGEVHPVA